MKKGLLLILIVAVIAFGAIGFFAVTATMSSRAQMELYMPKDEKDTTNYLAINPKLTIVLQGDNIVYAYYGNNIESGKSFNFKEVHNAILDGTNKYSKDSLFILIKPGEKASYRSMVDLLDEMAINNIKKYAMADMNEEEKKFLARVE